MQVETSTSGTSNIIEADEMGIDYSNDDNLVSDSGADADAEMGDGDLPSDLVAGLPEAIMGDGERELQEADYEVPMVDDVPLVTSAAPSLAGTGIVSNPTSPTFLVEHPGFSSPPLTQISHDGLQVSALGHSAADGPSSYFTAHANNTSTPGLTSVPQPQNLPVVEEPNSGDAAEGSLGRVGDSGNIEIKVVDALQKEDEDTGAIADGEGGGDGETSSTPQEQSRDDLDRTKTLAAQSQRSVKGDQDQEQVVETHGRHETHIIQRQSQEPPGQANGDESVSQENDIIIRQETDDESGKERVEVELNQKNKAGGPIGSLKRPVKQINRVKVFKRGDDCASCTHSGGTMSRPHIEKDLLSSVDLGEFLDPFVRPPEQEAEADTVGEETKANSSKQSLIAPGVLLTFNSTTYSLFRPHAPDPDIEPQVESTTQLLLGDVKEHELYYDQLESFIEALHHTFPELNSKHDEIVLSFDAIGIALPEDNVYTREVCLYDLDRVHVGCGLPGRLHITVETQPRFSTGFNALAQHVANSYAGDLSDEAAEGADGELEGANDELAPVEGEGEGGGEELLQEDGGGKPRFDEEGEVVGEGEERGPLNEEIDGGGEDGLDEEIDGGGEDVEAYEDGEWREGNEGREEQFEGEEEVGVGEGEIEGEYVDAEENFELLDDADLAATVEGAQEDYLLSETQVGEDVELGEHLEGDETAVGEGEWEAEAGEATLGVREEPEEAYADAEFVEPDPEAEAHKTDEVYHHPTTSTEGGTASGSGEGAASVPTEESSATSDSINPVPPITVIPSGITTSAQDDEEDEAGANDVVIDYEEVFDASAVPSPAPGVALELSETSVSPTTKRSHPEDDSVLDEGLEGDVASEQAPSEAKRVRLSESDVEPVVVP